MDLRFFYAMKSFSRCAQSRARGLDAERRRPGSLPGGERGRPAPRRARRSGAAGGRRAFLGHPPGSCLRRSGQRQAWKRAGRLGFVTALLGTGEARGAQGSAGAQGWAAEPPGTGTTGASAAVGPRNAVPERGALLWPGLSGALSRVRPGGCSISGPRRSGPAGGWVWGPFLAPQRPRFVPRTLGPCWCTCPPACPHGSFLGWQQNPSQLYSKDVKPASWTIWLPLGSQPVPLPWGLPIQPGLVPSMGKGGSKLLSAPH